MKRKQDAPSDTCPAKKGRSQPGGYTTSLLCIKCKANIFGTTVEAKVNVNQLSFLEDGASLHLVMDTRSAVSDPDAGGQEEETRGGHGTNNISSAGGFKLDPVQQQPEGAETVEAEGGSSRPAETSDKKKGRKKPKRKKGASERERDLNPYRSLSRVRCGGTMEDGVTPCNKKLGGVKCYPPLSDNRLVFLQHKAFLVDGVQPESWEALRNGTAAAAANTTTRTTTNNRPWSSGSGSSSGGRGSNSSVLKTTTTNTMIPLMRASREDEVRRFEPKERRPLMRSAPPTVTKAGGGTGTQRFTGATVCLPVTKTRPRPYQVELYREVVECERNSVVYLPRDIPVGRTLLAGMVMRRLLDLNPERQAFFLVQADGQIPETAGGLRKELGWAGVASMSVGAMLPGTGRGGGGGTMGDALEVRRKLASVRAASIVVATACAFEHALHQRYIDPDSICCVVMDEAHHSIKGKDHPLFRITKSPYVVPNDEVNAVMAARSRKDKDKNKERDNGNRNTGSRSRAEARGTQKGTLGYKRGYTNRTQDTQKAAGAAVAAAVSRAQSTPRTAAEFPKVLALLSSHAGERTVRATALRVEELMGRLGADLAAPADVLTEIKARLGHALVEAVHVPPTARESLALAYLERLVLRGVAAVAPGSDAAVQALGLLTKVGGIESGHGGGGDGGGGGGGGGGGSDEQDGRSGGQVPRSWGRFPNQAYRGMCEQALAAAAAAGGAEKQLREGEKDFMEWGEEEEESKEEDGDDEEEEVGGDGGTPTHLMDLMDLALAADELGGETTWGWLLHELEAEQERREEWREHQHQHREEEEDDDDAFDEDPELADTIHILKTFLPRSADSSSATSDDDDDDGGGHGHGHGHGHRSGGRDGGGGSSSGAGAGAGAGAGGGGGGGVGAGEGAEGAQVGSKLERVMRLLREHKERCESEGAGAGAGAQARARAGGKRAGGPRRFSALVLVSTRELARAAPGILESAFETTAAAGGAGAGAGLAATAGLSSLSTTRPRSSSSSSLASMASAFSVPSAEETGEPLPSPLSASSSSSSVRAVCAVGAPDMDTADQVDALEAFETGAANVLVSTPEYYRGGKVQRVPPGALVVVCLNLTPGPAGGGGGGGGGGTRGAVTTADHGHGQLEQLRGYIRCEGNFRFVRLTRNLEIDNDVGEGEVNKGHVKNTYHLRVANMVKAIERLKASSGGASGGGSGGGMTNRSAISRGGWHTPALVSNNSSGTSTGNSTPSSATSFARSRRA